MQPNLKRRIVAASRMREDMSATKRHAVVSRPGVQKYQTPTARSAAGGKKQGGGSKVGVASSRCR